jgi:hypothetical protein
MEFLKNVIVFGKRHYIKFILFTISAHIFFVVFFPFQDLRDLITSQVSFQSQKKVYLQMEDFGFSFVPAGVNINQMQFEMAGMSAIKADSFAAYPSIFALLGAIANPMSFASNPTGKYLVEGLFKGNIGVNIQSGKKTDAGNPRTSIEITAENLALDEIRNALKLKFPLKGSISLNSISLVDMTLAEQPEIQPLSLSIDKFSLGSTSINTQMGPVAIPELNLRQIKLEGRMVGSKLYVDQGLIGSAQDELSGTIKGSITINFSAQSGSFVPQLNGYNFDVNLKIKKELEERAQLFLLLIDRFKTPSADGSQYKFKISAPNTLSTPQFEP